MGRLKRTISHWTGGAYGASDLDRKHYHFITEGTGRVVAGKEEPDDNIVTSDGDYAAHTLQLNTGSIGCAMAAMHNAKKHPLVVGNYPILEKQFEAHCRHLAKMHTRYNILPITRENCLTHAEVEGRLGVKQNGKWDITVLLFRSDLEGATEIGDYMRERVRHYLGEFGPVHIPPSMRVQRTPLAWLMDRLRGMKR